MCPNGASAARLSSVPTIRITGWSSLCPMTALSA
jgi:hypothetical protein